MSIEYCEKIRMWWPSKVDIERQHAFMMKRVTDCDLLAKFCKQRRVCVQAGGMTGLWPRRLAELFAVVHTFEPDPDCYAALERNCGSAKILHRQEALGAVSGTQTLSIREPGNSRFARVEGRREVDVQVVTIDSLELEQCDAIVLDVEGSELRALRGAIKTVRRCRPTLMIEEWKDRRDECESYMAKIGYRKAHRVHNDVIYTC